VSIFLVVTVVSVNADELVSMDLIGADEIHDVPDHFGNGCCVGSCCCEPLWSLRAGSVIMKRGSPQGRGAGGLAFDYGAFDFEYEGGVDVSLIRQLRNGRDVEVRYFGIDHWGSQLNVGPLISNYTSKLHSTEINLRRQRSERLTTLLGFRWVEMHEEMLTTFPAGFPFSGMQTDNHMYGFQAGGQYTLWDRCGPLQITTGLKGGVYYNDADADCFLFFFPFNGAETHTAFLGECDITASVQLTKRCSLRCGYEFLWIDGAAEAGGQAGSILLGNNLDMSSTAFYHGAIIGFELTR